MKYEFKGTQGPWFALPQQPQNGEPSKWGVDIFVEGKDVQWLGTILGEHVGIPSEQMNANAQLVAAAPELLTALVTVYRTATLCGLLETLGEEENEYMIKAINKALNIEP